MAATALRSIGPSDEGSRHADLVDSSAGGGQVIGSAEEVASSWRRCLANYHVDPKSRTAPNILTETEMKLSRELVAEIVAQAREEIDRLYAIIRQDDYVVLLCNREGVVVHHRGEEGRAEEFKRWGIWLGGVWPEEVEGTNGIGTAIVEERPILIDCGQHFRTRHTGLTCAGAPISDPTGKIIAVLDASKISAEGPDRSHRLALAAITASARAIEERLFRDCFRSAWSLAAAPCDDSSAALLLAVDQDYRIVGADRVARLAIGLNDKNLADGVPLSSVFHFDRSLFRRGDGQDVSVQLMRADSSNWWHVLITPPLHRPKEWYRQEDQIVHTRPRISALGNLSAATSQAPIRGGLAPGLSRRISEHIESHLDQKLSLDDLAAMAGLSTQHFARAFRQSFGMPPHSYLLRRRLEHVEQMLRDTQLPVAEIAAAVGFSDQSHLTRHFHRLKGISPSAARWQAR